MCILMTNVHTDARILRRNLLRRFLWRIIQSLRSFSVETSSFRQFLIRIIQSLRSFFAPGLSNLRSGIVQSSLRNCPFFVETSYVGFSGESFNPYAHSSLRNCPDAKIGAYSKILLYAKQKTDTKTHSS